MSIAKTAAQAVLTDALLQNSNVNSRIHHLELELPLDKVIKFVSVGLPLMLVSLAFAREISFGESDGLLFINFLIVFSVNNVYSCYKCKKEHFKRNTSLSSILANMH